MRAVAMFTPCSLKHVAMCASTPGSSICCTTMEWFSPVMYTSTPSILRITAAPPPTLSPRTHMRAPSAPSMTMSMVLGCS